PNAVVNSARPNTVVNTARPKAVLSTVKGDRGNAVKASACWVWRPKHKGNPQQHLKDKGVINSGCSRHMTGNRSYLTDYEEIDGGFVAFGVPRKDNMYIIDLKNVVPQGGLTCLFTKATPDDSNLWHKRLGHVNFKTMNKLVRGNLVRGIENLIDLRVKVIRCDNGTEFKNRVMNQFYEMKEVTKLAFDIDALTKSMNKSQLLKESSNGNVSTKACDNAGKARMETVPSKDYILLPMWPADPLFSQNSKDYPNAGFKPSRRRKRRMLKIQGMKVKIKLKGKIVRFQLLGIENDDEDVGAEADVNNLDAFMSVSPIPTKKIHKDHPRLNKLLETLHSGTSKQKMTKNFKKQEEPKKVIHALKDPSWIEAMQNELMQFKLQKLWTLVNLS
ncbi:ribonuclease H-like domain-containing protein, partial [Tanacetum coccineum]